MIIAPITKKKLQSLPQNPGVYIYKNNLGEIIYIGKAVNIYKRVSQYFQKKESLSLKTQQLVLCIASIEIIETISEFDALLLESSLIRTHLPKFNIISRDDKSPLYIVITIQEQLPRILFLRKKDALLMEKDGAKIFGPFQSGRIARTIMHDLRGIIPFCLQKQRNGRACFYTHLELCSPCPSFIVGLDEERRIPLIGEYRSHINKLVSILSGRGKGVRDQIEKDMRNYAAEEKFELAQKCKMQLLYLDKLTVKHFDPMMYVMGDERIEDSVHEELQDLLFLIQRFIPSLAKLDRIECFDISHLSGHDTTASMVVLTQGFIDASQYKRFKIKNTVSIDDYASMHEVVKRRLMHKDWPQPDLIVVDGGKGQLKSALLAAKQTDMSIPMIGIAKRFEELIIPIGPQSYRQLSVSMARPAIHLVQRIRDESHRFAKKYHHLLSRKSFQNSFTISSTRENTVK